MCCGLHGHKSTRYLLKYLLHRFRCRRLFLFQKDFTRFIQNAVTRPAIAEVHTNRELVSFENHVSIYPNSANLFHCRSPFLCFEHVQHWERIASRGRPAFSSHLVNGKVKIQLYDSAFTRTWFLQSAMETASRNRFFG